MKLRFIVWLGFLPLTMMVPTTAQDIKQDPVDPDLTGKSPPNILIIQSSSPLDSENIKKSAPLLSRLAKEGIHWKNFYHCPEPSSTQASLLTGRYNIRTKSISDGPSRSMMATDEVTLAEAFNGAGYDTGFFGEWYLGENFPMRSSDQGFEQSLVRPSFPIEPPKHPSTDSIWFHNNHETLITGSDSKIPFSAAESFINSAQTKQRPFLCAISTPNSTHSNSEATSEIESLLGLLQKSGLLENTITVILPNPPSASSNSAPFHTFDERRIKTPLVIRLNRTSQNEKIDTTSPISPIDIMPTLMKLAGLGVPEAFDFDGKSRIMATKQNPEKRVTHSQPIVMQKTRGSTPEKYEEFLVLSDDWKLVGSKKSDSTEPELKLINLATDPEGKSNLVSSSPEQTKQLMTIYSKWFDDVTYTRIRDRGTPSILIDRTEENPARLTWATRNSIDTSPTTLGYWRTDFEHPCRVDVIIHADPNSKIDTSNWKTQIRIGRELVKIGAINPSGTSLIEGISVPPGRNDIRATLIAPDGKTTLPAYRVTLVHK